MDNSQEHAHDSHALQDVAQNMTVADDSQESQANVTTSPERGEYKYTMEEAQAFFEEKDFSVPVRTITNYCQTNQFQCKKFKHRKTKKWFAKESSLTRHLQQLIDEDYPRISDRKDVADDRMSTANDRETSHVEPEPNVSNESQDRPASSEHSHASNEESQANANEDLAKANDRIEELEKKLIDAEVEKRAAHQVRDEIIKQSRELADKYANANRQLGAAEAQLIALQAPKNDDEHREAA